MEQTEVVKRYDSIGLSGLTKKRVDELYYQLKISKNFKNYNDFINWLLDKAEIN